MLPPVFKIQDNKKIFLDFNRYGIPWSGTIHELRRLLIIPLNDLRPAGKKNTYYYQKNKKYVLLQFSGNLVDTSHAKLDWILRNNKDYVIMKQLKNVTDESLHQEAIVQILVYHCLAYFNIHGVIPQVYDIIRYKGQTVFTMKAFTNAKNFSTFLLENFTLPHQQRQLYFVEVLAQIALYMIPLQSVLYFNHRDLKSDNILIEEVPTTHVLTINDKIYTVKSNFRVMIVDFGFGCVGFETQGYSILNAGSVLPSIDPCPKEGRDIFHILTSLYSFNIFRDNLNPALQKLIDRWLTIGKTQYTEQSVQNMENEEWVYSITSGSFFSAPGCSPSVILADISEQYPNIVTVVTP